LLLSLCSAAAAAAAVISRCYFGKILAVSMGWSSLGKSGAATHSDPDPV
jgi:hypothetical protein